MPKPYAVARILVYGLGLRIRTLKLQSWGQLVVDSRRSAAGACCILTVFKLGENLAVKGCLQQHSILPLPWSSARVAEKRGKRRECFCSDGTSATYRIELIPGRAQGLKAWILRCKLEPGSSKGDEAKCQTEVHTALLLNIDPYPQASSLVLWVHRPSSRPCKGGLRTICHRVGWDLTP